MWQIRSSRDSTCLWFFSSIINSVYRSKLLNQSTPKKSKLSPIPFFYSLKVQSTIRRHVQYNLLFDGSKNKLFSLSNTFSLGLLALSTVAKCMWPKKNTKIVQKKNKSKISYRLLFLGARCSFISSERRRQCTINFIVLVCGACTYIMRVILRNISFSSPSEVP